MKRLVADYDGEHDHGDLLGAAPDPNVDVEAGRLANIISAADDAGSDDDDDDDDLHGDSDSNSTGPIEEQFHRLEEEVATLVADVHDLALYTKVCLIEIVQVTHI